MLGLAMLAALMGFLFWGLPYAGIRSQRLCLLGIGSTGFVPILDKAYRSNDPLQQKYGLIPTWRCPGCG